MLEGVPAQGHVNQHYQDNVTVMTWYSVWVAPSAMEMWSTSKPPTAMHINNSDLMASYCAEWSKGPLLLQMNGVLRTPGFINPELFTAGNLSQAVNHTFIYLKLTSF